jgi:glycosyltransferase involved in cell wall biosynthesis
MKVQVTLHHHKAKEILLDGIWKKVGEPLDVNLTQALRYARHMPADVTFDKSDSYNPDWYRKHKTFGLTGDADDSSGFGNCTINLVRYSTDAGYDVRWIGHNTNVKYLFPFMEKEIPSDIAMIYHEQPRQSWVTAPFEKKFSILPFETTKIPESWVPIVNNLSGLFAISDQNIQMFRDSGVTIPIEKIAWGIDEKKFPYRERKDDGIYTFGQCGALSTRKGTDLLVKAFIKAFPLQEGCRVRLLLKTSYNVFTFGVKSERRIQVIMMPLEFEEYMERFWNQVDFFCFPSRGEGWGLPFMESMAQGIPGMCTDWGGFREFATPETALLLNYKMVRAKEFDKLYHDEDCGDWAEPLIDEMAEKMRYAYYHQDEMKEMGKRAHEHIYKNFLWPDSIKKFHKALDTFL